MPTDASSFVHLHVRTEYSLLQSMIKIRDLVERAKEYGMSAIAITDYMTISGAVKFYIEAKRAGIKPIIGCEVEIAPDDANDTESESYRLVLLCQDEEGYKNICKLLTKASVGSKEGPGMIDKRMLATCNQGLIALSGWLEGELPRLVFGSEEEAPKAAKWYKDVFGDRFYLELVNGSLPIESLVNKRLVALGKEHGIPVVAAGYCAFMDRDDSPAHNVLYCMSAKETWPEYPEHDPPLASGYYFRSAQEMSEVFADCPEALANTLEIADRCNFDFELDNVHLPRFKADSQKTSAELFKERVENGFKARRADLEMTDPRFLDRENEYRNLLEQEKSVILDHKLADYLLIVSDYMNWARDNGIPVGPGRGSAAASLVNYCLGITDVNPLAHGLIFERFLSADRNELPDIDVDVCDSRRDEVIEYVNDRYGGLDHVARILTFGSMKARSTVRDVGSVLELANEDIDHIIRLIPYYCDLENAQREEPELLRLREKDQKFDHLFTVAEKLEGLLRYKSIHAAGLVISDRPLVELAPIDKSGQWGGSVVQYDMKDIERLGLVRFDILGLKTLTMLGYCLEEVRTKGVELDMSRLPLDDPKTYDLFKAGDTSGVFQFESEGMKEVLRKMRPDKFSDLALDMALYRPGPLGAGYLDMIVARKHDEEKADYAVPELEDILEETYGLWVYQEQIMKAAMKIAGYSASEADGFRKALPKRMTDQLEFHYKKFIEGATSHGLKEADSEQVFNELYLHTHYCFSKSHAVAYSMISYQTAYMKTNYPEEFRRANERMEALG